MIKLLKKLFLFLLCISLPLCAMQNTIKKRESYCSKITKTTVLFFKTLFIDYNKKLFDACISGDVSKAKNAIENGANVDAIDFCDNYEEYNSPIFKITKKFDQFSYWRAALWHLIISPLVIEPMLILVKLRKYAYEQNIEWYWWEEFINYYQKIGLEYDYFFSLTLSNENREFDFYKTLLMDSILRISYAKLKLAQMGIRADANLPHSNSPLHYAVLNDNHDVIKLLIDQGANVNAVNENLNSPLHNAVKTHNFELAKMLIAAGADVHLKNNDGLMPKSTKLIKRALTKKTTPRFNTDEIYQNTNKDNKETKKKLDNQEPVADPILSEVAFLKASSKILNSSIVNFHEVSKVFSYLGYEIHNENNFIIFSNNQQFKFRLKVQDFISQHELKKVCQILKEEIN